MAIKQYPLGIQTFERIRKEDKLYIDKTEYIYRMTHSDGTYFFVGRPRRFGKSLLVSTMQSYFEGKKDLFKGLAMEQLEKEWIEYPVIHLDMSGGKYMSEAQLQRYLIDLVEEQERKFSFHKAKNYGWKQYLEPVAENPYIDDYYKDISRWALNMEVFYLKQRFKNLLEIQHSKETVIQDRTIFEGVYVFAANNRKMGNMDQRDYDT